MPESDTRNTTSLSVRSATTSIRPPGGVNFAALCMRLVITWRTRAGSASILRFLNYRRYAYRQLMLSWFDHALSFFDRLLDDAPHLERFLLQGDSALRNSSDVEQIIDQPRELIGLPARNRQGAIATGTVKLSSRDSVEHCGQRVAQLMPQHREEFVLALIGLREFGESDLEFAFQFHAFGHVANEASRVDKLAVFPQPARMDENVLDRSVLASQRTWKS